jgi:hypothetical protein
MSDSRWSEVEEAAASAAEHFERVVQLHERGGFEGGGLDAYAARMAFMHAGQSGHTSLERVLVRILEILDEERPTGEDWHSDLIRRARRRMPPPNARPPILSERLCAAADVTRRFRNRVARNYDNFDAEQASPAVAAARVIAELFVDEVAAFRAVIDPS